ncbi:MAG TPA: ECF-type sigma factor [Chthoniobacterales bacterium]|nr:ECF-type sigma factor [Chthoniobacterales bacterium]
MVPLREANSEIEPEALSDLMPSVYEELRRLAADYLRGERPGHTLQPTALVHEAYLRLLRQGQTSWHDRAHVLGFGARIMRQILISHAIASTRLKRGGPDSIRITLDEALDFCDRQEMSVSAVDEALRSLEEIDPRQGQIVEMRFFGGLTIEEIAKALDISSATVKREWTFAKVWLRRELSR